MKRFGIKNWLLWCVGIVVLTGCHWDLWDQDRYEPLEKGDFWGEGESSSRPLVEGTVPYLGARLDTAYYKGMNADETFIMNLPGKVQDWIDEGKDQEPVEDRFRDLLKRGQNRFNIYCTPCHGDQGLGDGMITKRGFPNPPAYTDQRLLEVPIGYFFDVMTNGFGRMYSYASRVSVEDRWAIASYIRVLQLSQNATPDLLTEELLELARTPAGDHDADDNENEEEGQGEH